MIVGYLLVGIIAGLVASVVALLLGASFLLAFGLYTLVGTVTFVLLSLTRMLVRNRVNQSKAPTATNRWNLQNDLALVEPSIDRLTVATETPIRILAVDDDPFILELIPMISAKAGFSEITPAASGGEALELLENSETIYDCFLLDVSMPGMDGIELCRRVRKMPQYRQTPIVMLTAIRDLKNMGEAYRAGATDYATKPFDIKELGTRLRRAQEVVQAQRGSGNVRQEKSPFRQRNPIPNCSFEMPEALCALGRNSLIDPSAMSNYLTQLPRKELTDVQLFAVRIDGVEAVHAISSPEQFSSLIEGLAAATAKCFGVDRTVMAYTDDATLLVATNSVNPLPAISIEINIEKSFNCNVSEDDSDEGNFMSVSVGGPVQPQSIKEERAKMAIDRVIVLSENRALEKQGRQIAGLNT